MVLTHALTFLKAFWSVDTTLYRSNMVQSCCSQRFHWLRKSDLSGSLQGQPINQPNKSNHTACVSEKWISALFKHKWPSRKFKTSYLLKRLCHCRLSWHHGNSVGTALNPVQPDMNFFINATQAATAWELCVFTYTFQFHFPLLRNKYGPKDSKNMCIHSQQENPELPIFVEKLHIKRIRVKQSWKENLYA